MLGASTNEILLVVLLVLVVVLAPKVGRIGEAVGGLFRSEVRPEVTPKPGADPPEGPKADERDHP